MNEGLAVLGGWVEFGVLVSALAWFVHRGASRRGDANESANHDPTRR